MADPELAHADTLAQLQLQCDLLTPAVVGAAFVASLSTRRLAYRSALGSFAHARHLPEHGFDPEVGTYAAICRTCGWSQMPAGEEEPLERLALERERFGGVRHLDPTYALFDLASFVGAPSLEPTDADWQILATILATPAVLRPDAKAADLVQALKGVFPSNKEERGVALRILCYAGVLQPKDHPTFLHEWVPPDRQELPNHRFLDWGYPTIWWRAADGVNREALDVWFPERSAV